MGCAATATILGTQLLHDMDQPGSSEIVADISWYIGETSAIAITTTQIRLRGSPPRWHQASSIRHTFKFQTDRTDRTELGEELMVLMIDENKEQKDAETEYLDQDQPCNEQADHHMDYQRKEMQLSTLAKLFKAEGNDCAFLPQHWTSVLKSFC